MTLIDLANLLSRLGYPLAYSHFKSEQKPPFIVYLVTSGDSFSADNTALHESADVDIELYVDTKNLTLENQIKTLLKQNELPFSYAETYIKEEGVFKCTFSIQLI
ncbi:hypothetical protein BN1080_02071 [Planococcus massiliensis]|uniref:Prophage pi2 protein 38 n=1 Tax=Planococcus massiliensis TaxID=1499687 RepID=A0A098EMV7_9BACL|nr:hypothetical protein [Planococcus massiliensis]CEG23127.1 hypothetical protein BN1080_02071 [Planococcus massiliensis]